MSNLSFIGYGKLAKALIPRLIQSGYSHIRVASPSLSVDTPIEGLKTTCDNRSVVQGATIILLAVKPAQMAEVLNEIYAVLPTNALLISLATGLDLKWFATQTPKHTAIVRAMPNIAARVGQSATPLVANAYVNDNQRQQAMALFNRLGLCSFIQDESEMDAFTALSGSGPAYVFTFMQAMIDAAVHLGLKETIAKMFTLKTLEGALALAREENSDLHQLTQQVTSKGGTTEAALRVFSEKQFSKIIDDALHAAKTRAAALNLSMDR
jgi:pyrroline-5-carboxylate reductase